MLLQDIQYTDIIFSHGYFGVPHLQIEEFRGKSSYVLNKYKCLLSLHKHIIETELYLGKDDTFVSSLFKAKTETSYFRVYKKNTTMSDKASTIIRWSL